MAAALVGVLTGTVGAPHNPDYTAEELRFYLADLDAAALLLPRERTVLRAQSPVSSVCGVST